MVCGGGGGGVLTNEPTVFFYSMNDVAKSYFCLFVLIFVGIISRFKAQK